MSTNRAAELVRRDYARQSYEASSKHKAEMKLLALAYLGALALIEEFPDEVSAFDVAFTVVKALDASGVVFAGMSTILESEDDQ